VICCKGLDEGSIKSNFKPKTQARTNIIFAATYENGKQHKAESPWLKLKKLPVAFAELTKAVLETEMSFDSEVVPEVLRSMCSFSSTHLRINKPKLYSFSVPVFIRF